MGLVKKLTLLSGFFMVLLFLVAPMAVTAQWQGPTTILALTEGDGPNQVGVGGDESNFGEDAHNFCVDDQGNIIIADTMHNRILIFGPDGTLLNTIRPPQPIPNYSSWPGAIIVHPDAQRILLSAPLNPCVYDYEGNIHKCFTQPRHLGPSWEEYTVPDGFILNQSSNYGSDDYWSVDLEGNLVGKLPERPLELGRFVTENGKKYLKFPGVEIPADAFWNYEGCHLLPDGSIYCEFSDGLYNSLGVQVGSFALPPDVPPPTDGADFASYEGPVLDSQGNMYVIKYSLDHYTILKWTYVGPEAAAKSKSSTAPESKSTAKAAPSVKPSTKAGTGDVKQPAEQKPEATAKPPAKEGKKATPEVVQKEQKKG